VGTRFRNRWGQVPEYAGDTHKNIIMPIAENNYPKEAEIPGLPVGLAHALVGEFGGSSSS